MGSIVNSLSGLGSTQSSIQPIDVSISTAGSVTGGLISAGSLSLPGIASASLAVPVIGAAVAGVTLLVNMWLGSIAKHNAEKTATTAIVNQAEPYLKQNVNAFNSLSAPTQSEQTQALANFDNIWAQVAQACSNGGYEDAGKRCVSDRSTGGATDWFAYYRDPIANSTKVVPDETGTSDVTSSMGSVAGLPILPILLIGAGLLFFGGKS